MKKSWFLLVLMGFSLNVISSCKNRFNASAIQEAISPKSLPAKAKKKVGITTVPIKSPPYSVGQVIVKFKKTFGLTKSDVRSKVLDLSHRIIHQYSEATGFLVVEANTKESVKALMVEYMARDDVAFVEPNYLVKAVDIPDDPSFGDQWGLHNVGQNAGNSDVDINFPESFKAENGAINYIGVIDSGVDYNHQDLKDNMWTNPDEIPGNGIDDDGNGYVDDVHGINTVINNGDPMDDNGHGTHVAGIISAKVNNTMGVAGISKNTKIIACKFLNSEGSGYLSDALKCMEYFHLLASEKGIPIVATNNSWGGTGDSEAFSEMLTQHKADNILFIAAAGNDGKDNDLFEFFPANNTSQNVIAVGAMNRSDQLASYSNYGRRNVHVVAPGSDILSTYPDDRYVAMSGTSMATPFVSGLVGLLKSQQPALDWSGIKNLVLTGGIAVNAYQDKTLSGRRIRLSDSDGKGALTCQNQVLISRIFPLGTNLVVSQNEKVDLQVLHLDCANPAGSLNVTVEPTGETLVLTQQQDNGVYIGSYTPSGNETSYVLNFGNDDPLTLTISNNYLPVEVVPQNYRVISGQHLTELTDDETTVVNLPFKFRFANTNPGYDQLYVSANGIISLTNQSQSWQNKDIPGADLGPVIAPFWDDLRPANGEGIFVAIVGTSPDQEAVIEWRNIPVYGSSCPGDATFQVVIFENRADVLINYKDVTFDQPACSLGNSATVGLQVTPAAFNKYSFNQALLTDGLSLLWRFKPTEIQNVVPAAEIDVSGDLMEGATVTLSGSRSQDPDGTIVKYAWDLLAGDGDLSGTSGSQITVRGNAAGSIIVRLTVTDDKGGQGVKDVTISLQANLPPVARLLFSGDFTAGTSVDIDGRGSNDPENQALTFRWRLIDNQCQGNFVPDNQPTTQFTGGRPGTCLIELQVRDPLGKTGVITQLLEFLPDNLPPGIDIGPDILAKKGEVVELTANVQDPEGKAVSVIWEQLSGPPVFTPETDLNALVLSIKLPAEPTLLGFSCTATDDRKATGLDTIYVIVSPGVGPQAITPEQLTVAAGTQVQLNGSSSFDADGKIIAYRWEDQGGPNSPLVLENTDQAIAQFSAPVGPGSHSLKLTVKDDEGLEGSRTVTVNVVLPPTAKAGKNVAVLAGKEATLDASASSSPDSLKLTYKWSQIDGPSVDLSDATQPILAFPIREDLEMTILTFRLAVTDERGITAEDIVSILVMQSSLGGTSQGLGTGLK